MRIPVLTPLRYRGQRAWARAHTRWIADVVFVHINKTGGSSVEEALGLPFQHRTAREILADIGPERWEERFSFSFVRNPWDKVASHYHFRVKTNQTGLRDAGLSFTDWVTAAYGDRDPRWYDQPKMFMPQAEWLRGPDGRVIVDFIGRFERLQEDFSTVCDRIGRPDVRLPHLKRSDRPGYRELYDDESAAVVRRRFAEDLERFDYRF